MFVKFYCSGERRKVEYINIDEVAHINIIEHDDNISEINFVLKDGSKRKSYGTFFSTGNFEHNYIGKFKCFGDFSSSIEEACKQQLREKINLFCEKSVSQQVYEFHCENNEKKEDEENNEDN